MKDKSRILLHKVIIRTLLFPDDSIVDVLLTLMLEQNCETSEHKTRRELLNHELSSYTCSCIP